MPFSVPYFDGDDHRQAVSSFVTSLQRFLNELVSDGRDPFGRYIFWPESVWPDLMPRMRAAWEDMQPSFDSALNLIQRTSDESLVRHGLTGVQLAFKLEVVRFFSARYESLGKNFLSKLLNVLDDLLKSILDAVGAGGAISEMKDFIKDSVDD